MSTDVQLDYQNCVADYEMWFDENPHVFKTELEAIKKLHPEGEHLQALEVGVATGRFATALGISHGIEPIEGLRLLAAERGIHAINAYAENLPYEDECFDFVLMNFCLSYFSDALKAFSEAWRVLHPGGYLIIGFLEKNGPVATRYERNRTAQFKNANVRFYAAAEVAELLNKAGFAAVEFSQTLFHQPENTNATEPLVPGYGSGSYVLVRAEKSRFRD